ncbi:MAG: sigma-70 family RNA polymerase sigma factor, partial [Ignavibacteriae bacterium]|nr:sigma-70 family RNA polymerase sigma factor [Ignavibacteriota bacterium]
EDIVSEAIVKALEHFDEDRGSFESLCLVIIKNKIFNLTKHNKYLYLLVLIDEAGDIIDPDPKTIEKKEQNIISLKYIDELKKKLSEDELKLLNAYYELCESTDKPSISEASRMIGIEPNKGWDIFRRIQKKAVIKKYDDIGKFEFVKHSVKSKISDKPFLFKESQYFVDSFEMEIETRFEMFVKSLSKENLSKLERIYKD